MFIADRRQTRPHRKQRLRPFKSLYLRLLVNTEHERLVRRVHVETDDVTHLGDEQWIVGELEGLDAVRLKRE